MEALGDHVAGEPAFSPGSALNLPSLPALVSSPAVPAAGAVHCGRGEVLGRRGCLGDWKVL